MMATFGPGWLTFSHSVLSPAVLRTGVTSPPAACPLSGSRVYVWLRPAKPECRRSGAAGSGALTAGLLVRLSVVAIYAAYGSNMDPGQMASRCPHSPQHGSGWLEGWRLTFGGEDLGWEGAMATVVEAERERVFVVLYEVPPGDEASLDQWDGATLGLYRKIKVRVSTLDGEVVAWLYVLNDYEGGLPSARYLGIMSDAAEAAGAPDDYVAGLRRRPCTSVGK